MAREHRAAQRKARYGRSKQERELARWEAEHREKNMDGKRLGGNPPGDDSPHCRLARLRRSHMHGGLAALSRVKQTCFRQQASCTKLTSPPWVR